MQHWHDIAATYRSEAWSDCARLARAHVDEDPFDLSNRALLASVLMRSRQRPLALMQYERLLPLAVGQGELFRAIGTQRRLDELHPPVQRHPDRYRAIQDWFRALNAPAAFAEGPGGARGPLAALLGLPPEAFSLVAEQSKVVPLDLEPQQFDDAAGILWVVYFGRIRWRAAGLSGADREWRQAAAGEMVHLPQGDPAARWIEVVPETPCEVIHFDPALAELLAAVPGVGIAAAAPARPRPDPRAEPTVAVGVPRERRRGTRMAVMLEHRVALLGEEGTSVAPMHGTVVDVSLTGLGLEFPVTQIRGAHSVHPQALVTLEVGLRDSDGTLPVTGRIAWIEWHPAARGQDAGHARIGLEFVAMSAEQRARLGRMLDVTARKQA